VETGDFVQKITVYRKITQPQCSITAFWNCTCSSNWWNHTPSCNVFQDLSTTLMRWLAKIGCKPTITVQQTHSEALLIRALLQ